jgi:DNA-binding beta-propeller fold protein YncE
MRRQRLLFLAIALATLVVGRRGLAQAPKLQVDPLWPKPLPNHWLYGSITGVAVDARDHVWLVHRGAASLNARTEMGAATTPPTAEACCVPAPPVLEFDPGGTLVRHWGGRSDKYEWPASPGGITVDANGNVWIAAAGWTAAPSGGGRGGGTPPPAPPQDAHVLKFSPTGEFLLQIGKAGAPGDSNSRTGLNRPTGVAVDVAANEVYVADGVINRRIVVFDATSGAYKRHWGANENAPDDTDIGAYDPAAAPAKQFRSVSCVRLSRDGHVYVCDRKNDRIQVFTKQGRFVKQAVIARDTKGEGSVWDIAFSRDPAQRYLFVADGQNQKVHVVRRDTLTEVSSFGGGGRWPGAFYGVGSVAVDSKGNVYTGESYEGKRLQKFRVMP